MSSIDEELRGHFDDLRAEDRSRAPEFSALWREAGGAKHQAASAGRDGTRTPLSRWRARPVWLLAAAASVVIAATVLVQRTRRIEVKANTALADTVLYPSITSWRSPTDGLLRMSQGTARSSPSILGSVLDGVATSPVQRDSSKRGGL